MPSAIAASSPSESRRARGGSPSSPSSGSSTIRTSTSRAATGTLATYPVVFTSLTLILQPRCGGPFTASLLVNSLKGLIGFGSALAVLSLASARWGSAAGLLLGLAVAVGWNCGLFFFRHRRKLK